MKMRQIPINLRKVETVDYKEYFKRWDAGTNKYELKRGAPLIINIGGHYCLLDSIIHGVNHKDVPLVHRFITAVKSCGIPPLITWKPYL